MDRSARLLAGLGGICGMLLPREGVPEEVFPCSWDLLGLGGTCGISADMIVGDVVCENRRETERLKILVIY